MKRKKPASSQAPIPPLRKVAERQLRAKKPRTSVSPPATADRVLHELHVHQIELEMQNEELRLAHAKAEKARAKFADLYDFAPIGYFTVDGDGDIVEVNISGAKLLGLPRRTLLKRRFDHFLAPASRAIYRTTCRLIAETNASQTCELRMLNAHDRSEITVMLKGIRARADQDAGRHVLLAISDITEHRLLSEASARTQELFQLVVENVRDYAIVMLDAQGYVVNWNEGGEQIFGYREAEVVGRHISCFYPEADNVLGKPAKMMAGATAVGRSADEGWRLRKDGARFWAQTVMTPICDETGRLRGFAKVTHDMSARKRMEEDLRESAGRLQAILDNSSAPIFLKDQDGRYLLVNRKFEATYHLDRQAIVGKTDREIFPPEMAAAFRANDQKILTTSAPAQFEEVFPMEDGPHVNVLMKFPLFDAEGNVRAIGAIATDITDRIRATAALQANEERIRAILDRAYNAFVEIDDRGLITAWNLQAEKLFGWRREDVIGRQMYEIIVPPQYREAHLRGFYRFMETGEGTILNKRIELTALKRDGTEFPVEISVSPLRLAGKLTVNAFIADISEQKRAMAQLQQSHEQLEMLTARLESVREEERTRIAHEIHDELGQALTGLKLDITWLKRQMAAGEPPVLEKLDAMAKLTDTITQNVREIATELRPVVLDQFGLLPALEWAASSFQLRTGIQCKVNFYLREARVDKDASTALYRIFQEVLTNIARHAEASRVDITAQENAGRFVLEVLDNGRGITEEQAVHPKSFGVIGMHHRAALVHGDVSIRGTPNQGTTVRITVPFGEPAAGGGGQILSSAKE